MIPHNSPTSEATRLQYGCYGTPTRTCWSHRIVLLCSLVGAIMSGCMTPYVVRIDGAASTQEQSIEGMTSDLLCKIGYRRLEREGEAEARLYIQMQKADQSLIGVFIRPCPESSARSGCATRIKMHRTDRGLWLWIIASRGHDDDAMATAEKLVLHFTEIGRATDVQIKAVPSLDFR